MLGIRPGDEQNEGFAFEKARLCKNLAVEVSVQYQMTMLFAIELCCAGVVSATHYGGVSPNALSAFLLSTLALGLIYVQTFACLVDGFLFALCSRVIFSHWICGLAMVFLAGEASRFSQASLENGFGYTMPAAAIHGHGCL